LYLHKAALHKHGTNRRRLGKTVLQQQPSTGVEVVVGLLDDVANVVQAVCTADQGSAAAATGEAMAAPGRAGLAGWEAAA
jgi:hypothetical protein